MTTVPQPLPGRSRFYSALVEWSRGKSGRQREARLVKNEGQLVQASWTESAAENIPPSSDGKGEKVG